MSGEDDYEILPHEEVEHLRKEAEKLRTSPSGQGQIDQRLISSIQQLTHSIQKLESVFDSVRKDILRDFETTEKPEDLLKKLIEQNKSVAEVLVNLVEKVNGLEQKKFNSNNVKEPEVKINESSHNKEPEKPSEFDLHKKKLDEDFDSIKKPQPLEDIPKPIKHEEKKGFLGMFKK